MIKRLFSICTVLGIVATATPAPAGACSSRDTLIEQLQKKYSEQLAAGGLQKASGAQAVMEIWASEETGTYTVLLSHANGISCVVAAGTDFFKTVRKQEADGVAS